MSMHDRMSMVAAAAAPNAADCGSPAVPFAPAETAFDRWLRTARNGLFGVLFTVRVTGTGTASLLGPHNLNITTTTPHQPAAHTHTLRRATAAMRTYPAQCAVAHALRPARTAAVTHVAKCLQWAYASCEVHAPASRPLRSQR